MELIEGEEQEDDKIELIGEIWINLAAINKEILIKGKWRLTSAEEEFDFEYNYFKDFDKTLGLPPVENPVFTVKKDYTMLVKQGLKTPGFNKSDLEKKNIPKLFGGIYRGWFSYNDQTLAEFSSLNFLPNEDEGTQCNFIIEGNNYNSLGDGHNSIGVYIIDGSATFDLKISNEEEGEMVKIGDIKLYKYYSTVKEENEPIQSSNEEELVSNTKISLKIRNKRIFELTTLTPEEAAKLRKTLPQLT